MKPLSLIDKAFLLKRTQLFAALDLDLLLSIADKLGVSTFDAGETIFSLDQDAHRMYLIARGSVRIRTKDNSLLALLGTDEFFGDESLFHDRPRAYEAFCESDALLLSLSRTNLLTIISECPSVAVAFLHVYASSMIFRSRKPIEGDA